MKRFLLVFLAAAVCAGQDRASSYTIAGTVTDSVSGQPSARVRVVLAPAERPTSELSSGITAGDGRFHFEVSKGKYQLRAERNGLPGQPYGAESIFPVLASLLLRDRGRTRRTSCSPCIRHPPSPASCSMKPAIRWRMPLCN